CMKQVLQNMKTGAVTVVDVPAPVLQRGRVLVRAVASLISAGTERLKVELGRKSLLSKARTRPDLVRQVVEKAKREGVVSTYHAVRAKLDAYAPLGYSAAGLVVGVGAECVVIGLGLLGQLTVQLLKAHGCRVFGVDLDASRVALACMHGADAACAPDEDVARRIEAWTRGRGADAVVITAATRSNQPIELAGRVSRLKGRVVAVGLVGMDVPRELYYERELTLHVSMSYGPGRYDAEYEERGHDYPFAYVRWTEARNIEAFLDALATGSVRVAQLITLR